MLLLLLLLLAARAQSLGSLGRGMRPRAPNEAQHKLWGKCATPF